MPVLAQTLTHTWTARSSSSMSHTLEDRCFHAWYKERRSFIQELQSEDPGWTSTSAAQRESEKELRSGVWSVGASFHLQSSDSVFLGSNAKPQNILLTIRGKCLAVQSALLSGASSHTPHNPHSSTLDTQSTFDLTALMEMHP